MKKKKIILLSVGAITLAVAQGAFSAPTASSAFKLNLSIPGNVGIYGERGSAIQSALDFPAFTSGTDDVATMQATFATDMTASPLSTIVMSYVIQPTSGAGAFQLTGGDTPITYTVKYTDCTQTTTTVTSGLSTALSADASSTTVGASNGCYNWDTDTFTPGAKGVGTLTFTIPGTTTVSPGNYSQGLTITVCNGATCAPA